MPTDQTEDKTQDNGEGTNKLTLYTWNIQDGGGTADGRFKYVQAAHNKIVEKYEPDIIVINEITNPQGAISPLTTDNYCLLITHLRMRIWVGKKSCVSDITIHPPEGLEFTYETQCKKRIRIWAAHVPCNRSEKSKSGKFKKRTDENKLNIIRSHVNPQDNNHIIAIGDFNLDAIVLQNARFPALIFPIKYTSLSVNYKNQVVDISNVNNTTNLSADISDSNENEASYNTWFNKPYYGNFDYFISNIQNGKFTVHNIEVKKGNIGRASDHNAIVVTLEIPRPDSNDGQ